MLPGVDLTEMLLLGVVALVLMGPRDLPLMMRRLGRFTGKMRAMAFEFRQSFDELGRQAELEELKKEVAQLRKDTGIDDLKKDVDKEQRDLEKDIVSSLGEPDLAKVRAGIAPATPALDAGAQAADGAVKASPAPSGPAAAETAVSQDTENSDEAAARVPETAEQGASR